MSTQGTKSIKSKMYTVWLVYYSVSILTPITLVPDFQGQSDTINYYQNNLLTTARFQWSMKSHWKMKAIQGQGISSWLREIWNFGKSQGFFNNFSYILVFLRRSRCLYSLSRFFVIIHRCNFWWNNMVHCLHIKITVNPYKIQIWIKGEVGAVKPV